MINHLRLKFGKDAVVRDVDNIPIGSDFCEMISREIERCNVLIAVIGPDWVNRLSPEDETDFIRMEIEAGLRQGIDIIPVLVGGTAMPNAESQPESVRTLVQRNALKVDAETDFGHHMRRLVEGIRRIHGKSRRQWLPRVAWAAGLLVTAIRLSFTGVERPRKSVSRWTEVIAHLL